MTSLREDFAIISRGDVPRLRVGGFPLARRPRVGELPTSALVLNNDGLRRSLLAMANGRAPAKVQNIAGRFHFTPEMLEHHVAKGIIVESAIPDSVITFDSGATLVPDGDEKDLTKVVTVSSYNVLGLLIGKTVAPGWVVTSLKFDRGRDLIEDGGFIDAELFASDATARFKRAPKRIGENKSITFKVMNLTGAAARFYSQMPAIDLDPPDCDDN